MTGREPAAAISNSVRVWCVPAKTAISQRRASRLFGDTRIDEIRRIPFETAAEMQAIVRRKEAGWLDALPELWEAVSDKLPVLRDLPGAVLEKVKISTKADDARQAETATAAGESDATGPRDVSEEPKPPGGTGRSTEAARQVRPATCALIWSWLVPAGQPVEQKVSKNTYERIDPGDRVLWQEVDGSARSWGAVLAKRPVWRAPERLEDARRPDAPPRRQRRVLVARLPVASPIPLAAERKEVDREKQSGKKPGQDDWMEKRERRLRPKEVEAVREITTLLPRSFEEAFWEELAAIHTLRARRGYELETGAEAPRRRETEQVVYHQSHRARLAGLAFSGGGIRSATFNLGVLQALAKNGLLGAFDYLSTVSGGGYIGSWLVAWIKRRGLRDEVKGELYREHATQPLNRHLAATRRRRLTPITFLRRYSNFLTPRLGVFGADSWTVVATYLRNLLLNLLILTAALSTLLLIPRLAVEVSKFFSLPGGLTWAFLVALGAALLGMFFVVGNIWKLSSLLEDGDGRRQPRDPSQSGLKLVTPLFVAAWAGACWTWLYRASSGTTDPRQWPFSGWMRTNLPALDIDGLLALAMSLPPWLIWSLAGGLLYVALGFPVSMASSGLLRYIWRNSRWLRWNREIRSTTIRGSKHASLFLISAFVAGFGGGLLLWWCTGALYSASVGIAGQLASAVRKPGFPLAVLWGPPILAVVISVTATLHLGLLGRGLAEDHRQWWSRLGAWLLMASLAWAGVFSVALYGPVVLEWLAEQGTTALGAVSLGWLASTLGGLWAARGARTGDGDSGLLEVVAKVTPYVFVVGLLALLASAIQKAITAILAVETRADGPLRRHLAATWEQPAGEVIWNLLLVTLGLALAAWILSRQIDLNEFSMHLFYRSRLVRAYLGASRMRQPHPFTGFDPRDDLDLGSLLDIPPPAEGGERLYDGPFPILNTALNLAGGGDLAQQQRKADSFFFTPLHYGFDTRIEPATEPDRERLLPAREPFAVRYTAEAYGGEGISLGIPMTVSGAAVSPNMGYHSSTPLAFLMTVFNARLGLWLGNPKKSSHWQMAGPGFGLIYLLAELFGYTTADSRYVSLSDGGHFDNLGIYELVRRRCRYIVACDAEADPDLSFGGLTNAVRRCRADFGVDIEIDVGPIRADAETGLSRWHGVVGRIHYPDESAPTGVIVYIKASMTGDEPEDVMGYKNAHASFPHESTGDQWFDETQFESYRALGFHAVKEVFGAADLEGARRRKGEGVRLEPVFVDLRHAWYRPSQAVADRFTQHTELLVEIFDRLRTEENLAYLVPQFYIEFREWRQGRPVVEAGAGGGWGADALAGGPASPSELSEAEFQEGFFLCNTIIQLMENVYLDLGLEGEWDHPDNRGWMNLFHHWSWSWMFRTTWAVSAATYGARFQKFCERRLAIPRGRVAAAVVPGPPFTKLPEGLSAHELSEVREIEGACSLVHKRTRTLSLHLEVLAPGGGDPLFSYPFGFAMLHEVAQRGVPEEEWESNLIFLRVRDHLRKLGLGRQALRFLMTAHRMVPAPGFPPDRELAAIRPNYRREQIRDLVQSVWTELQFERRET